MDYTLAENICALKTQQSEWGCPCPSKTSNKRKQQQQNLITKYSLSENKGWFPEGWSSNAQSLHKCRQVCGSLPLIPALERDSDAHSKPATSLTRLESSGLDGDPR